MLKSEELKAIRERWVGPVCNDSSCDLTGAQYCVECANASIPALLDTVEELRGLLEDARIVLYGTDEVGQYNMAQQIQEALK